MAQEILREVPSTINRDEIRLNLEENATVLAFLEQAFNIFADADSEKHPIHLSAPSWWGLARLMRIANNTMDEAYSELE